MAMQGLVVLVNDNLLRELDELAQKRHVAREQVVSELLQDALRRTTVREQIFAELERRQASPTWNTAFERIEQFRSQLPDIPEEEPDADIEIAVQEARKTVSK